MILTNPHNQRTQLLIECCLQLLEDHRGGHGAGLWLEFTQPHHFHAEGYLGSVLAWLWKQFHLYQCANPNKSYIVAIPFKSLVLILNLKPKYLNFVIELSSFNSLNLTLQTGAVDETPAQKVG